MAPPGTFERVFAAIRERLCSGHYKPGARLEPAALSDELNASVTPVRDALHRLTGERLVEAPRHEGFRVPMMTEATLRHLYGWHRDLLTLSLMSRKPFPANHFAAPDMDGIGRSSALFSALVQRTGNPEHLAALRGVTARLGSVQRLESLLLDELEDEANGIIAALRSGDRRAIRRTLAQYHRRRERIVPDLVERLLDD